MFRGDEQAWRRVDIGLIISHVIRRRGRTPFISPAARWLCTTRHKLGAARWAAQPPLPGHDHPRPAIDPCKPRWAGRELTCAAIGGAQAKAKLG